MIELVNANSIAEMLGEEVSTVRMWARARKLPGTYKLHGAWRFDPVEIKSWRDAQKVEFRPTALARRSLSARAKKV